jgi:hypothetical protein
LRIDSSIEWRNYEQFIDRSDPKNDLKRLLDESSGNPRGRLEESDRALIAYCNCKAFGAPRVPYCPNDFKSASVRLGYSDCNSVPLSQVRSGIEALQKAVNHDKEPPGHSTASPTPTHTPTATPTEKPEA